MNINNSTRRIVFLNNLNSPQIEQAIFILRDNVDFSRMDAVTEAQKIVNAYLTEIERPLLLKNKKTNRGKFFFSAVAVSVVAVTVLLVTLLH